ncbi:hypothetical protein Q669_31390 [Labrenzia sp. C1B10]|nr:hypothetical protein Q669_31390 [Labrenzia sp. C1B10]ERS09601.1 hypothetical protein Q675_00290 [Labrenzia sp. C1B70]
MNNFFNSEEHRKQIVLFTDAPLNGKVEALPESQHGFKPAMDFLAELNERKSPTFGMFFFTLK